jgi:methylated-DNA-protein-cysteine methyltransferase-like protein
MSAVGRVATGAADAGSGVVAAGSSYDRIYAVVRKIPRGRVTTYGTVARLAGLDGQARLVGYALSALRDGTGVPWHRVINAQGRLSLERAASSAGATQFMRLAREGVRADAAGRISLAKFGWRMEATSPGRRIPRTESRPLTRTKRGR